MRPCVMRLKSISQEIPNMFILDMRWEIADYHVACQGSMLQERSNGTKMCQINGIPPSIPWFQSPPDLFSLRASAFLYLAEPMLSDMYMSCEPSSLELVWYLTHWGRDKMAAIFQTTFSNAISWMKMFEFRLKFYWSLFLKVQLIIFQHWFR